MPDYVWQASGGIYMLCRREPDGSVTILYIGQAHSIAGRLGPDHHRWVEAISLGMNEIHVHLSATVLERDKIEAHLIGLYSPPLNRQKPTPDYLHDIFATGVGHGPGLSRGIGLANGPPRNALLDFFAEAATAPRPGILSMTADDQSPLKNALLAQALLGRR